MANNHHAWFGCRRTGPANLAIGPLSAHGRLPSMVRAIQSVPKEPIRSQADRWARFVILLCCSQHDCNTLKAWAHEAGASYTTLRECCYMMQLQPLASRDFARLLRVALWSPTEWRPDAFLVVSDSRTLRRLESWSGLAPRLEAPCIVTEYLDRQRLIPHGNPALAQLRWQLRCAIESCST